MVAVGRYSRLEHVWPTIVENAGAPGDPEAVQVFSTLGGGANQAGGRAYNERLTISLIRLNGPLPKAELGPADRAFGADPFADRQAPRIRRVAGGAGALRGRIGQPSVPYALNPLGALSFGVKIGRRTADVVLCDLNGRILERDRQAYDYPLPDRVIAFVTHARGPHAARALLAFVSPASVSRCRSTCGNGQAKWTRRQAVLTAGRTWMLPPRSPRRPGFRPISPMMPPPPAARSFMSAIAARTSTCSISSLLVRWRGVALGGTLYKGRTGNAGALGSMPISIGGARKQLIHHASLLTLERELLSLGHDVRTLQDPAADWSNFGAPLDDWLTLAAEALALTMISGLAVIDFGVICIDGAMPRDVLARLVERIRSAVDRLDTIGLSSFEIRPGVLGADAQRSGRAMLPIMENYGYGQDVLLKATVT